MTRFLIRGLLALGVTLSPLCAQPMLCPGAACGPVEYHLTSASTHARYGLLVRSPAQIACGAVQFIVSGDGRGVIGRTAPLREGELQVVRIGQGFAMGEHALVIRASGCPVQPAEVRRVRLGKASPDHGWRAAAVLLAKASL